MKVFFLIFAALATLPLFSDVIVMRHGEADHNVWGRFNSDPKHENYVPSFLTAKGEEEVREAAKRLKREGVNITRAYISPLPHAVQTADILMEAGLLHQRMRKSSPHLIEAAAGSLENRPLAQRRSRDGESLEQVRTRIFSLCAEAARGGGGGDILIVTHQLPAALLVEKVKGRPAELPLAGFVRISHREFIDE